MDVPAFLRQADGGNPFLGLQPVVVLKRTSSGQPTAVTTHDFMDDQHTGVGAVLTDDVLCILGDLFSGGPCTQGLADRHNVVVDRLGQADDRQVVVMLFEVGSKICSRGVGVVATDGVQNVNAILTELLSSLFKRIFAFGDKATLDEVLRVGQLDARVTNRGATEAVKDSSMLTSFFVNDNEVAGQQTVVAVLVRDDLDRRIDFVVALNEATNSGRKTRSEATGGEQSDATNRHGNTFQRWNKCGRTTRTSNTTSLKPQWSWYGGSPVPWTGAHGFILRFHPC